jgi:sigma-E factor negative regulatory protein RseA
MNENLSALMDGELDRDEALAVIKSLGQNAEQRAEWDCYHLIGDSLRGETAVANVKRRASAEAIFARLAEEPTILAPQAIAKRAHPAKAGVSGKTRVALAMAASVVTISAIGVVAYQQRAGLSAGPSAQIAQSGSQLQSQSSSLLPGVVPVSATTTNASVANGGANVQVNDYLVVHRQFANPNAFRAATVTSTEPRQAVGQ